MNFVAWGVYYAIILIVEKGFLMKYLEKTPKFIRNIYAMLLVLIGWVLFASADLTSAIHYIRAMFGGNGTGMIDSFFIYNLSSYKVLLVTAAIAAIPMPKKLWQKHFSHKIAYTLAAVVIAIFICTAYLVDSSYNPFLYFRF